MPESGVQGQGLEGGKLRETDKSQVINSLGLFRVLETGSEE